MTSSLPDSPYRYPAVSGISFRSSKDEDKAFIRDLHRHSFKHIVEDVFGGWNPEDQKRRFEEKWRTHEYIIAQKDDAEIGVIWVEDMEETLFLQEIMLAPEHQGKGIGTKVIAALKQQACDMNKDLMLQVFKVNRAHKLYERLGFAYEGENDTHFVMIYRCEH